MQVHSGSSEYLTSANHETASIPAMTAQAVAVVRGPCMARKHRLTCRWSHSMRFSSSGGFDGGKYGGVGSHSVILEWRQDTCTTGLSRTHAEGDDRDSPTLASGNILAASANWNGEPTRPEWPPYLDSSPSYAVVLEAVTPKCFSRRSPRCPSAGNGGLEICK